MFQPLLCASMSTLTNRVVPISRVFGSEADAWSRAVHSVPDVAAKIALAEAFLVSRLPPWKADVARLRDLVERMAIDRSLLRVEDVAAVASLDVRALQRAFRTYVGVSPKWVIGRYRLHEAAEQLKSVHPPALAELAASLGYADQAHFARDFKLVVGRTPRTFALTSRAPTRRSALG
ncbi:hypothetical protein BH09MYX1_BH09MYX1_14680 [soil metagenome]